MSLFENVSGIKRPEQHKHDFLRKSNTTEMKYSENIMTQNSEMLNSHFYIETVFCAEELNYKHLIK